MLTLWKAINAGENVPGWEKGKALEYLVLRAFQIEGADIRWPYPVDLGGEEIEQIDGAIHSDGLSCIIECKDQTERVSIEPIAKLRNQLLRRPGTAVGIVFSKSGFTDPAVTLARFVAPQAILLWYGREINYALENSRMRLSLMAKYRHCIETGFPDFNILSKDLP